MLGRLAGVLVVASCVSSSSVRCPDGSLCPDGTTCATVDDETLCVAPDQIADCVGKDELAECGTNLRCYDGVCLTAGCGNGRLDPDEACDDGNTVPDDGCSTDCRSDETCGNGVVDLVNGEQCDDGPAGRSLTHDGCASDCTVEAAVWTTIGSIPEGDRPGVAYDAARDRLVAFVDFRSVGQTWEWDGARWMVQTPRIGPVSRPQGAMAYDAVRGRTVIFGGGSFNDTWEWDGTRWELRAPVTTPPARNRHAMAYDAGRQRIVMFGGLEPQTSTTLGDTWTWDGTDWTQITGPGPSPRHLAGLAYDPKRDVVVLHGGALDATVRSDETWTLAGSTWTKQTPLTVPPARSAHALAWDPRSDRLVMHGGAGGGIRTDTWLWNGVDWTLHPTAGPQVANVQSATLGLAGYAIMIDRGRMFRWDNGWTLLEDSTQVGARFGAAGASDPAGRRMVLHGGTEGAATASTLVWTGAWQRFNNLTAGSSPGRVTNAAMAYDSTRREFVHFGGFNVATNADSNETWVFTTAWTQRTPAAPLPPPRLDHVLVHDAARGQTLLFGGTGRDDTWLWNGTAWTPAQPTTKPSARSQAAAAYDPKREVIVLFGGFANGLALGDTWEWNGVDWTRRMVPGPPARAGGGLAWDTARQRLVLVGGFNNSLTLADQWEWDGSTWTQVPVAAPILGRANFVMASALGVGGVLVFGGTGDSATEFNELVWLRWDNEAPEEVCDGIDRDGDQLTGCNDPDCWRVCTPECVPGTTCATGAARCGDGTCNAIAESCSTCVDCTCAGSCGDLVCGPAESCPGDC